MSEQELDRAMREFGIINPLTVATNQLPVATNQLPVATISQQKLTRNQQNQLPVTNSQLPVTNSQLPVTNSQYPVATNQLPINTKNQQNLTRNLLLTEQGQKAKGDLEILVATGQTRNFLGKTLTYFNLDRMPERALLKYHRLYQSALAVKVNNTFGAIAIKTYAKLASWALPIADEKKLRDDLSNDIVVRMELDKWVGWLTLRMGGLMAVASASLLTVDHVGLPPIQKITEINGGESGNPSRGDRPRPREQSPDRTGNQSSDNTSSNTQNTGT